MADNPISNSGITPTPPTPEYGRDKPKLGEGEEAQEPKPFSLSPERGKTEGSETVQTDKPSPMDVAREGAEKGAPQRSPEQLGDQIGKLKEHLNTVQTTIQNPDVSNKFTRDHFEAMNRVMAKMNPDMRTIGKESKGEFNPPQHISGEPILNYVTRWINGSQQTLSGAMNFLGSEKSPNPASFLKLQYSVQRASQRGELFASIVGSSVSGIKTILSTQLG